MQEKLYGKTISVADREMVEERADAILSEASDLDVAFLVVGDPFGYCLFVSSALDIFTSINIDRNIDLSLSALLLH